MASLLESITSPIGQPLKLIVTFIFTLGIKNGGKNIQPILSQDSDDFLGHLKNTLTPPPSSLSWIQRGTVPDTKNQGPCPSGWAFSLVSQAESFLILSEKASPSINLSEKFLADCTEEERCEGISNIENKLKNILEGIPEEQKESEDVCGLKEKI